jgi:V8-like Glu-specific endopeptidase
MHVNYSSYGHSRVPGRRFALTTCTLVALLAAGTWTTGAPAQEAVTESQRGDPLRFWTPERFRNAKPVKLPEVDALDPEPSFAPRSVPRGAPSFEPGSPPSVDLEPDPEERLFEPAPPESTFDPLSAPDTAPIDQAELMPSSISLDSALYTNTRVFPTAALLEYPYRTTGRLFAFDPVRNAGLTCSAAAIQRRLIATAGHCVFNAEQGYFFTNFVFVPAYDNGAAPFGPWSARTVITTRSWVEGGGIVPNPADFALIALNEVNTNFGPVAIGDATGWLGWLSSSAAFSHVTMLGYPSALDAGERMQQTNSQTFSLEHPNAAVFGSQLSQGSSGGPYVMSFGQPAVGQLPEPANLLVGIMSFVVVGRQLAGTSIINGEFEEILNTACAAEPGNCI